MEKLKDLTPKKLLNACWPFPGCPAIFETDDGHYILVGKQKDATSLGIKYRVSEDEVVIEVPKHLIDRMSTK